VLVSHITGPFNGTLESNGGKTGLQGLKRSFDIPGNYTRRLGFLRVKNFLKCALLFGIRCTFSYARVLRSRPRKIRVWRR